MSMMEQYEVYFNESDGAGELSELLLHGYQAEDQLHAVNQLLNSYTSQPDAFVAVIERVIPESAYPDVCNVCGCLVQMLSGNFVNRTFCADTIAEREETRDYPKGDYICAKCTQPTVGEHDE